MAEKIGILNEKLLEATNKNDVDLVSKLLNAGAYPNVTDKEGKSPLHHAAKNGNEEILDLLIEAGAGVDQGIIELTELGPEMTELTPLDLAAWQHHYHIIEKLLFYGADINICDLQGNTLIMRAIIFGDDELAETLMNLGSDINLINFEGKTALHYAVIQANRPITIRLIELGAQLVKDNSEQTPLDYGARSGIDLLIRKTQKDIIIKKTQEILQKIFLVSDEEDLKIDVIDKRERKKTQKPPSSSKNDISPH